MGRMVEQKSLLRTHTAMEHHAVSGTPGRTTLRSPGASPSAPRSGNAGLTVLLTVLTALALMSGLASACDDSTRIPNALPSIPGVDTIDCIDGTCDVWLRVVDPDLDGVDVGIECLLDGEATCVLEDAAGTDGRFGLVPERTPPGRSHLLRLVPVLSDESATLRLRFTPTDMQGDSGTPFTTPGFTMADGLP